MEIDVDKLGVVKINKNSHLGRKKACKEVSPLRLQKVLYFTFKWLPFKGYAPILYTLRDIFFNFDSKYIRNGLKLRPSYFMKNWRFFDVE